MTGIIIYMLIGMTAGFMAGLLGIGGGVIIVPGLLFGLLELGLSDDVALHIALGTSLASIFFTASSSMKTHHERGYVRWDIFKKIIIGILVGTFIGAQTVGYLPSKPLKWIFIVFLFSIAIQILLNLRPKPTRKLPGTQGMTVAGMGIGFFSSFIGTGGASLSVPFMGACNVPAREVIGTSSAIGLPIAFAGALGNMVSGFGHPNLPAGSIGYVYLPALFFIVVCSIPMARMGAKVAHRLSVSMLKKIFASTLIFIALQMLYSMCSS